MDRARQHQIAEENRREVRRPAARDWSLFVAALAVIAVIFGFMYYSNYAGVNPENAITPSAGDGGPAAAPVYDGASNSSNMRGATPYNDDTSATPSDQRTQP